MECSRSQEKALSSDKGRPRLTVVRRFIEPAMTPCAASLSCSAESLPEESSQSGSSNSSRTSLHDGEITPKRKGIRSNKNSGSSSLNFSLSDELSPLKDLSYFECSVYEYESPVMPFMWSPQFIQKAVLKQKDTEIRMLKQQLYGEVLLKEEAQILYEKEKKKNAECACPSEGKRELLSTLDIKFSKSESLDQDE